MRSFWRKLAVVGSAAVLTLGLGTIPAHAAVYVSWENDGTGECLDYRSDYGPYATTCNRGTYQAWLATLGTAPTAMRQESTRLCLVARSGQPVMRDCLASDPAALWRMVAVASGYYRLQNNVTGTCLTEQPGNIHHVTLSGCGLGAAQSWDPYVN
ncbi:MULTISPECIES: ricin-type beta-trefoil lectin domain protein [unclassified Amycolatopsis]|uniref:RICIN domain-containing protein n=1 Tax=unclassified Amycolatopsis TaxID=2618356 RepID=UPI001C694E78|nr:ricin-type beta-trefoil lectin domain protein [Amycolatopsis sp. DSM 110486]QYN19275.1 RICIN domain-containing protein [Amycolatopsis sp. DSM 110486]